MDCKDLKVRLQTCEASRQNVQEQWDLIRQYVTPYRGQFFEDGSSENNVRWRENRRVFDSTAVNANNVLASSLHGAITNPSHQWFNFRFRNDRLSENREAAQWLRDSAQITFETVRDSNFNLQVNEGYIDLTSFGTGFVTREILEKNGQFEDFLFKSIPLEEGFFEQDYRGRVSKFYRKMKWTALQIKTKFGEEGLPEKIKSALEANRTQEKFTVVFAVWKRDGASDSTTITSPENRPVGYCYFLYECGTPLGKEGGYYTMPVLVMRWRNTADSIWGNSPAMHALPDILTLNQLVELILNSLEKVVDPALITTERGLLSNLDLGPAGINVVRQMDELAPFESRARFDVAELNREKLQQSIRQMFYVDQLELKDSPAMTATEVQVRYELMQRLLGPTLGRLQSDFLDPLVGGVFADLLRYRQLPDIPAVVAEDGDPAMNIIYTGPMARAQMMDQASKLQQFMGMVAQVGEINPEALQKVDWDQCVALLSEYTGAEPKVLKSDSVVKKERRERQEMEQRMMAAQAAEQEGKADKALGEGGAALRAVQ